MKRTAVSVLVLAMLAGALVAPADAKKKKKKAPAPVALTASESKFFLRWPDDGAGGCAGVPYMSIVDGEKATTCSNSAQPAQEALAAVGQDLVSYLFPAKDGVPATLDASRKITGEMVLRGTITAQAYVQLTLTGTVDGAEVTIAEGETTKGNGAVSNSASQSGVRQDLPGPAAVVPVELAIDPALDKKTVTSLTLTATIRGVHRGGFDYDRTPSHIIIPTFI